MNMKIKISVIVLLLSLMGTACTQWLNVEPEGEATDEKLYKIGDGYRTALAGVYSQMSSKNLYGMELGFGFLDCLSQQYTWDWTRSVMGAHRKSVYNKAGDFEFRDHDVITMVDAIWQSGYNVIANTNNLINHTEQASPSLFEYGDIERDMILGEAYACRALMHFDLCRLFMPAPSEKDNSIKIPYITTYPTIQANGIEIQQFLDNVISDFKKAAEYTIHYDTTALGMALNAGYRARFYNEVPSGLESKTSKGDPAENFLKNRAYRLSYYSINALLARVYQYMGDYDKASEYAQKVLDFKAKGLPGTGIEVEMYKEEYMLYDGLRKSDNAEHKTDLRIPSNIIFALYNENAYNEYNIASYFMKAADQNSGGQWFILDFVNKNIFLNRGTNADEYESDHRGKKHLFTPEYQPFNWGDRKRVYSLKLFPSSNTQVRSATLDKTPVMRISELIYILAENAARKSDYKTAYEKLNQLRQLRGLWDELPQTDNMEQFMGDLVRDAQREFISEGQLFYLYKRLKYPIVKENAGKFRPMNKAEYMAPIPVNQNF